MRFRALLKNGILRSWPKTEMKRFMLFFLIMLEFALTACSNGADSYTQGLKAYQEQKYEEAEKYFKRALSQGNSEAALKADLALTHARLSRWDEALKELNEAYQTASEDTEVLKRIGLFYEMAGDPGSAASFYTQAIERAGGKQTADVMETEGLLAVLYKRWGEYGRAVDLFNILIENGYHAPEHILLAGECYLEEHQIYASTQYFDLLEQCSMASPDHYLYVVQALQKKGAKKEAQSYLNKGLELIKDGNGTMSPGEFFCHLGLYDDAKRYAEGKNDAGAYRTMALIALHENDTAACEDAIKKSLEADPDNIDSYALYVLVKAEEKDEQTVKRLLSKINADASTEVQADALWNQIILYENAGNYQQAYKLLKDYAKRFRLNDEVRRELKFLSRVED